jgi:PAS domain-containing protein
VTRAREEVEGVKGGLRAASKTADEHKRAIEQAFAGTARVLDRVDKDKEESLRQFRAVDEANREQAHINRRVQFGMDRAEAAMESLKVRNEEIFKLVRDVKMDVMIVENKLGELGNPRIRVEESSSSSLTPRSTARAQGSPQHQQQQQGQGQQQGAGRALAANSSLTGVVSEAELLKWKDSAMPALSGFTADAELASLMSDSHQKERVGVTAGPLFTLDRFGQVDQWGASASAQLHNGPADVLGKVFPESLVGSGAEEAVRVAVDSALQYDASKGEFAPIQPAIEVPVRVVSTSPRRPGSTPAGDGAAGGAEDESTALPLTFTPRMDVGGQTVVGVVVSGPSLRSLVELDRALVTTGPPALETDLLIIDRTGRVIEWSAVVARLTGLKSEGALKRILFTEFIPKAFVSEARKVTDLVIAGRVGLSLVLPIEVGGRVTKFRCSLAAHTDVQGRTIGVRFIGNGHSHGVTDDLLAEAEAIAHNPLKLPPELSDVESYNAALRASAGGAGGSAALRPRGSAAPGGLAPGAAAPAQRGVVMSLDRHGRLDGWSNTAEQLTGLLSTQAIGHRFVDEFVPESMWKEVQTAFAAALKGFESNNIFLAMVAGGNRASFRVNFAPKVDAGNYVAGVLIEGDLLPARQGLTQFVGSGSGAFGEVSPAAAAEEAKAPSSSSSKKPPSPDIELVGGGGLDGSTSATALDDAASTASGRRKKPREKAAADAAASIVGADKDDDGTSVSSRKAHIRAGASAAKLDPKVLNQVAQMQEVLQNHQKRHEAFEETLENEKRLIKSMTQVLLKKADAAAVTEQMQHHREHLEELIRQLHEELVSEREALATTGVITNKLSREIKNKASRKDVAKLEESLKQAAQHLGEIDQASGVAKPLTDAKCISCNRTLPDLSPHGVRHVHTAALTPKQDLTSPARIALDRDREGRKNEYYPGFNGGVAPRSKNVGLPKDPSGNLPLSSRGASRGSLKELHAPHHVDLDELQGTVIFTGGHPTPPPTAPAGGRRPNQPQAQAQAQAQALPQTHTHTQHQESELNVGLQHAMQRKEELPKIKDDGEPEEAAGAAELTREISNPEALSTPRPASTNSSVRFKDV